MAASRKYAGLPDLDLDQDVYETPAPSVEASAQRALAKTRSHSSSSTSSNPQYDTASEADNDDNDDDDDDDDNYNGRERHPKTGTKATFESGIRRTHIDPERARSRFLHSRVDASGVDFSDRVTRYRRSYRTSTKPRRRRRKLENNGNGDATAAQNGREEDEEEWEYLSSSEDNISTKDGLRRRIVQMAREADRLSAEWQRQRVENNEPLTDGDGDEGQQNDTARRKKKAQEVEQGTDAAIQQLNAQTNELYISALSSARPGTAAAQLLQRYNTPNKPPPETSPAEFRQALKPGPYSQQQSLSLASSSGDSRPDAAVDAKALALAADLSSRIDTLERSLGLGSIGALEALSGGAGLGDASTSDAAKPTGALLPTLARLERQMYHALGTSPVKLDQIRQRVRQLSEDVDLLNGKRKTALAGYEAVRNAAEASGGAGEYGMLGRERQQQQQLAQRLDPTTTIASGSASVVASTPSTTTGGGTTGATTPATATLNQEENNDHQDGEVENADSAAAAASHNPDTDLDPEQRPFASLPPAAQIRRLAWGLDSPEQLARIDKLYSVLPGIEAMAPLLPQTLYRLRELRRLHQQAGDATTRLADLEGASGRMGEEVAHWSGLLEAAGRDAARAERKLAENAERMEGKMKELETMVVRLMENGES